MEENKEKRMKRNEDSHRDLWNNIKCTNIRILGVLEEEEKEKGKNLQDQINEEEIGNLPEKEFRVMIVKMIQNLRNRKEAWTEKIQKMFNKDLEELKNKQR